MGANAISWKRVQRVNRRLEEQFVHASTSSHGEWWRWFCIRHDGTAASVNTRTWEVEEEPRQVTSTQRLLRERRPTAYLLDETDWLAELDERAATLVPLNLAEDGGPIV